MTRHSFRRDCSNWPSGYPGTTPHRPASRCEPCFRRRCGAHPAWSRGSTVPTTSGAQAGEVVELLERAGGSLSATALRRKLKRPVWDVLQRLARAGVITLEVEPRTWVPREGPSPSFG